MASVRRTAAGNYELRVRNRILPKDVYFTFGDEQKAKDYGAQLESLLARGVVPQGLIHTEHRRQETLHTVIRSWQRTGKQSQSDDEILNRLAAEVGATQVADVTHSWAEAWLHDLKVRDNLAPGTIRKRVGALSRCLDWHLRQTPDAMAANPLRMLPRGSASYSAKDAESAVAAGGKGKTDIDRSRRLLSGEHERIMRALSGEKRPDRERPIGPDDDLRDLYLLILATGIRLREAYTIRREQVSERVLRIRCSKQWHGREAWRDVPMVKDVRAMMASRAALSAHGALLFPWWDGSAADLKKTTAALSRRFGTLFAYAGCSGLTEHDLRHEATCRWFEMRDASGGWLFRDAEIERIMGWAPGSPMSRRYASFRAEDLASRID